MKTPFKGAGVTCKSKCPECNLRCRVDHRKGPYEGMIGQVRLQPAQVNNNGFPQVWHGHVSGHTNCTGFHAHTWWTRPSDRFSNIEVAKRPDKRIAGVKRIS